VVLFRKVHISTSFFVSAALWVLVLPLPWVGALFIASVVHELGHFLALKLLGAQVNGMFIGASGAKIHTGSLTRKQELISSVAGPLSGLLLLVFAAAAPRVAFCAFIQSMVNLIPVYPSDGGRVLRCLVEGMKILLAMQTKKG
jgi:stage IV sporulation protein FB